ncbi:hypothetical protein DJ568_06215 [Mucilaginibacter hurinus]|uniref:Glycosyltransferase RgtA/B/C/D-like domain-containing protein n=1 Tax=Mucilaginibacter hurinus TaxID=2201324 RepID=A0A367GQY1_9SPHI|nr:glycosyltransferase family 39 protein [Mucilaginibacter hurinus]RCH55485.1 hypothetical protein DJ568_06215 [Mucilaginibacter hurinus]
MAIIILPVCFIAILLNLALYTHDRASKRSILLEGVLVFCGTLLFITELLSGLKLLHFGGLSVAWIIATLICMVNLFINKSRLQHLLDKYGQKIKFNWERFTIWQKLFIYFSAGLLFIVFVQGVIYPPNNWDSMTYHLGRITSWVSNNSVDAFQTHITRQLYQPPFAEYVILHFNVLNGADYFSNSVQLFFGLFVLVSIAALTQQLKLNRWYQILSVVVCITIPEFLLQASSTQNDIVVSFFLLTSCFFGYKAIQENSLKYYCFTGTAAALALVSKGTAYIYLAPVLLLLAIIVLTNYYKTRQLTHLVFALAIPAFIIAFTAPGYYRNYQLTGNILGVDKEESQHYANQRMSPVLLLSNIVKNGALHTGIKYTGYLAAATDTVLHKIHKAVEVDINDPAVNYRNIPYSTHTLATQEDSAPNLYHLILISGCVIVLIKNTYKRRLPLIVGILFTILFIQLIVFCGYLKWQPWHSRLHLPMFILFVPLICFALSVSKVYTKVFSVLLPFILLYSITVVAGNETRPLKLQKLKQERFQKYFATKPESYGEYKEINEIINTAGFSNIGLILGVDDWQYPLFVECYRRPLRPVHINVNNFSKSIPAKVIVPDCIVSTTTNLKTIEFNGRVYNNITPDNIYIFLYK